MTHLLPSGRVYVRHARDLRNYPDGSRTLCLRRSPQSAVDDPAEATCGLCLSIQASREKMDQEVRDGTFWDRFR